MVTWGHGQRRCQIVAHVAVKRKGGDLHGRDDLWHDGPGQHPAQQSVILCGQHRQEPDGAERHLLPGGLETGLSSGVR